MPGGRFFDENFEFLADEFEGKEWQKEACDIRRYECRRTKLHEIASQPMHFVRTGNENATASRSDHEEARRVAPGNDIRRTEANFRSRFARRRMDDGGEISAGGHARLSKRDGFLPRRGALKNAAPGRLPPGEVRSSSTSLFPLPAVGAIYAAFLQKCSLELHS